MNYVEVGQALLLSLTLPGLLVVFELYLGWCGKRAARRRRNE